jgi:hypothetical protein
VQTGPGAAVIRLPRCSDGRTVGAEVQGAVPLALKVRGQPRHVGRGCHSAAGATSQSDARLSPEASNALSLGTS